jgi:hypothetical protein
MCPTRNTQYYDRHLSEGGALCPKTAALVARLVEARSVDKEAIVNAWCQARRVHPVGHRHDRPGKTAASCQVDDRLSPGQQQRGWFVFGEVSKACLVHAAAA